MDPSALGLRRLVLYQMRNDDIHVGLERVALAGAWRVGVGARRRGGDERRKYTCRSEAANGQGRRGVLRGRHIRRGDKRRLEEIVDIGIYLEVADARKGWQIEGILRVEDGSAFGGAECAQADTVA